MIEREDPGPFPFTQIENTLLNDASLSAEALGVLVYLLSKPANWNVMPAELGKRFDCGRDKIYKILNILVSSGYARREQLRDGGEFGKIKYVISSRKSPLPENTEAVDSPYTGKPDTVKTTLQKKESTKERKIQNAANAADDFFSAEPNAPPDRPQNIQEAPEAIVFREGRDLLGKSSGGMIKKLLDAKHGNIASARAAILEASTKDSPREYIGRIINRRNGAPAGREPDRPGHVYGEDWW